MKVAIVSSCYGDYDPPKHPTEQITDHEVEYVMVTDDIGWSPLGWTTHLERRPHLHPNVAAKYAKFLPNRYTDAEMTVWVDAGSEIGPGLVEHVASILTARLHWGMFPHPHRTKLCDEVAVSRTLRKYDLLPMERQVDHYNRIGYPDNALWATGCIARWKSPATDMFGTDWLAEVARWGFQDQLSFAMLAWADQLTIDPLGESLFTSPHIRFADHTMKP